MAVPLVGFGFGFRFEVRSRTPEGTPWSGEQRRHPHDLLQPIMEMICLASLPILEPESGCVWPCSTSDTSPVCCHAVDTALPHGAPRCPASGPCSRCIRRRALKAGGRCRPTDRGSAAGASLSEGRRFGGIVPNDKDRYNVRRVGGAEDDIAAPSRSPKWVGWEGP